MAKYPTKAAPAPTPAGSGIAPGFGLNSKGLGFADALHWIIQAGKAT